MFFVDVAEVDKNEAVDRVRLPGEEGRRINRDWMHGAADRTMVIRGRGSLLSQLAAPFEKKQVLGHKRFHNLFLAFVFPHVFFFLFLLLVCRRRCSAPPCGRFFFFFCIGLVISGMYINYRRCFLAVLAVFKEKCLVHSLFPSSLPPPSWPPFGVFTVAHNV